MRISVAVRNEASSIRILPNLLLRQTLKPVEIILADGGPQVATLQTIEESSRTTHLKKLSGVEYNLRCSVLESANA